MARRRRKPRGDHADQPDQTAADDARASVTTNLTEQLKELVPLLSAITGFLSLFWTAITAESVVWSLRMGFGLLCLLTLAYLVYAMRPVLPRHLPGKATPRPERSGRIPWRILGPAVVGALILAVLLGAFLRTTVVPWLPDWVRNEEQTALAKALTFTDTGDWRTTEGVSAPDLDDDPFLRFALTGRVAEQAYLTPPEPIVPGPYAAIRLRIRFDLPGVQPNTLASDAMQLRLDQPAGTLTVDLRRYVDPLTATEWTTIEIPLDDFRGADGALADDEPLTRLGFRFMVPRVSGTIDIDDIQFV